MTLFRYALTVNACFCLFVLTLFESTVAYLEEKHHTSHCRILLFSWEQLLDRTVRLHQLIQRRIRNLAS